MKTVLFACVHNAGRSQMAAAWFNALADHGKARAVSAGTEPGARVHPEVAVAMREVGIELEGVAPQRLTEALAQEAAILVTMGCAEACPVVPGLRRLDWPLEDPKGKPIERVREIRDEVRERVTDLLREQGWVASPPFSALVRGLAATVPFVAPDALERAWGAPLRLRLGANESLFGPSPRAVAAMRAALDRVALYGDPESAALRAALAEVHRVTPDNVVVCSGIDDLLGLAVRAFVTPGVVAVTSLGGYPTFNYHVLGFGGRLERVPYRDDANDLQALLDAARRVRARLVYLANPDNPSGTWHPASTIQAFIDGLPDGSVLLLDEAYVEFAPASTAPRVDGADPRVIRMRTFSKAHGMAGARIGYGVAARETVAAFDKIRHHFGVNAIAQAGALASLGDMAYVDGVVAEVAQGRRDYAELAQSLGLRTLPSATNFVAFDVGGADRARALLTDLQRRGVFVRMPGAPPLDRCIRVTVAPAADRAEFGDILRELWSG
jgi:histidinol-phosphate aminotransferase